MTHINQAKVTHVLLTDGWHEITSRSFEVQALAYGFDDYDVTDDIGLGFTFIELGRSSLSTVSGPLSSVLAVKEQRGT